MTTSDWQPDENEDMASEILEEDPIEFEEPIEVIEG